uniref:Uncharacterized protein n=1 Tax=Lepeophtheirus salmonis TaxID=72036 RepID=A0A0K2TGV6_LEPSM
MIWSPMVLEQAYRIIIELVTVWPDFNLVHGKPSHS